MRPILASVLLSVSALPAQTLLALEQGPTGATMHEIFYNCTSLRSCTLAPSALPNPPVSLQGGVAWTGQFAVVTDGLTVTTVDLACNVVQSCTIAGGFGALLDIAVDGPTNTLDWTDGGSFGSVPLGCPMGGSLLSRAGVPSPLQAPVAALDIDNSTGHVWVCDAAGTVAEVAFTTQWSAAVVQSFPAQSTFGFPAPVLPILGLAFDRCASRVYLADASGALIAMDLLGNPRGWCRPASLAPGSFFTGIARRPRQPTPLAGACSGAGMPSCQPRTFTTGGDVIVPNPNLRIEVAGAPRPAGGPTVAILFVDVQQGYVVVPGLCGPLMLAATSFFQPMYIGTVAFDPQGTPPCDGRAWAGLPVPNSPALCRLDLYFQWAFLGSTGGLSLSDALWVRVD